MNDRAAPADRRLHRRIPLGSPATIVFDGGDSVPAECIELSVGGMTLHSTYVPGESEVITVEVTPPATSLERPPLVVRLEVRRCHRLDDGRFEIGGAIVSILG